MSFVIGNAQVIEVFKRFRSQIDYGIFLPVQAGAVAALKSDDAAVQEQCKKYQERRDALCEWPFVKSDGTFRMAGNDVRMGKNPGRTYRQYGILHGTDGKSRC